MLRKISKIHAGLLQRRKKIELQKERFFNGQPLCEKQPHCNGQCSHRVNADIVASWWRTHHSLHQLESAPNGDAYAARLAWEASPLRPAAVPEIKQITQLARESPLAAAIADPQGRLLWTTASRRLQPFVEAIQFTPGSHWAEHRAGANAISLALNLKQPCTVFAAEHYLSACHDIVCYASPIIHPQSGQLVGVLDMSTGWQRHNPLIEEAVSHLAQAIALRLPARLPLAELEIHALGQPSVLFQGKPVHLSLRQLEILCILALNPEGLLLEALHACLYRDASSSHATIKTIITQLRQLLNGQISSHPYRLLMPVWADFSELSGIIQRRSMVEALKLYQGELLPTSTAPAIEEWRNHIEAGMEELLYACHDPRILIDNAANPLGLPLIRERLLELMEQAASHDLLPTG
ncbi:MAG: transcriptional regulator [Gammaproteobacteria bacterium]|nr:transcriptional regulator [Gammaproteobacteria bacterium]MBU1725615.1 transcriptional regulator [Gammaproteobacteria bacterium]MBU2004033.1 transcriptional regulator [Gammaproteobacteria bacterium]